MAKITEKSAEESGFELGSVYSQSVALHLDIILSLVGMFRTCSQLGCPGSGKSPGANKKACEGSR